MQTILWELSKSRSVLLWKVRVPEQNKRTAHGLDSWRMQMAIFSKGFSTQETYTSPHRIANLIWHPTGHLSSLLILQAKAASKRGNFPRVLVALSPSYFILEISLLPDQSSRQCLWFELSWMNQSIDIARQTWGRAGDPSKDYGIQTQVFDVVDVVFCDTYLLDSKCAWSLAVYAPVYYSIPVTTIVKRQALGRGV